jgi:hypothetical protein
VDDAGLGTAPPGGHLQGIDDQVRMWSAIDQPTT